MEKTEKPRRWRWKQGYLETYRLDIQWSSNSGWGGWEWLSFFSILFNFTIVKRCSLQIFRLSFLSALFVLCLRWQLGLNLGPVHQRLHLRDMSYLSATCTLLNATSANHEWDVKIMDGGTKLIVDESFRDQINRSNLLRTKLILTQFFRDQNSSLLHYYVTCDDNNIYFLMEK